jgi:acylphosphatase
MLAVSEAKVEKARAKIIVSGIVQGVGYRFFAVHHGNSLKLNGYVRNTRDGRVEAEVEGEKGDVERFVSILREGPGASRVTDVQVEWKDHTGELNGFSVAF